MKRASFSLPSLGEEPQWGPSDESKLFSGIPFQSFSRGDRGVGRISDWNSTNTYRNNNNNNNNNDGSNRRVQSAFAYSVETNEADFKLVDTKPPPKPKFRKHFRQNYAATQASRRRRNPNAYVNRRGRGGGRGGGGWNNRNNWSRAEKVASVHIEEQWSQVKTWTFDELSKAEAPVPEVEDLVWAGHLNAFKKSYNRVNPNTCKPLITSTKKHYSVSTSDDPILQEYIAKADPNDATPHVFATDTLLSSLMGSTKSIESWDMVVEKKGNTVLLNKRTDSRIDYLTVNENWNEIPTVDAKDINHSINLSNECTSVDHRFSQQVLDKDVEPITFDRENPFAGDARDKSQTLASGAFRYRSWKLEDNSLRVTARCHVDGYDVKKDGTKLYTANKALTEFDPKLSGNVQSWTHTLEAQQSAALATEMKNNTGRLTRWAAETHLSGVEMLKLGYVARKHPRTPDKHLVLKIQSIKPQMFANQMRVKSENWWGIVKEVLVNGVKEWQDGTYVLVKDPKEPKLHAYSIPQSAIAAL